MKKLLSLILAGVLMTAAVSCGRGSSDTITVISREGSSGTRSAFVELMGILDEQGVDLTTPSAEETQSTNVMMTTVAGNVNAIGYVSLGSLADTVKTVKVDGVAVTVENIKAGSYKVSRPFNIVYKDGISELAKDFIAYILSAEGQAIIEDDGYIKVSENAESYASAGLIGKIILDGSTSVGPVMEKLADAYKALNSGVEIEIQQTGSSSGISSAIDGICDIGMSSRELKDSETEKGAIGQQIALDGIAVIVNKENGADDLTSEQIKKIYTGEITSWSDLTNEGGGAAS